MDNRVKIILSTIFQILHLVVAGALLMLGFVVFIYTAPMFDLLIPGSGSVLPEGVFPVRTDFNSYYILKCVMKTAPQAL